MFLWPRVPIHGCSCSPMSRATGDPVLPHHCPTDAPLKSMSLSYRCSLQPHIPIPLMVPITPHPHPVDGPYNSTSSSQRWSLLPHVPIPEVVPVTPRPHPMVAPQCLSQGQPWCPMPSRAGSHTCPAGPSAAARTRPLWLVPPPQSPLTIRTQSWHSGWPREPVLSEAGWCLDSPARTCAASQSPCAAQNPRGCMPSITPAC